MSKRPFEEAADYAARVTGPDAQAPPASPPRFFPGQWSDDFSEVDPAELTAPPSLYTTFSRLAATVSNITNLFGIRDYFLRKFFRKQVIIARPVITNDGSRKKRLIDGGVADDNALNEYIAFDHFEHIPCDNFEDVEEDIEVDDFSFADVFTSTPRRPPISSAENTPTRVSPVRAPHFTHSPTKSPTKISPTRFSPLRAPRFRNSPIKTLPATPSPNRNHGSMSPTHRTLIRNRLRGDKAIREQQELLRKQGLSSPVISPGASLLLRPSVNETEDPPPAVSPFVQSLIANQNEADDNTAEPEVSLYSNDLSELPDAPPRKSVRLSEYARTKPFFHDDAVNEMLDSSIEAINFSPVRVYHNNFQQGLEEHGNCSEEVGDQASSEEAFLAASSTELPESPESVGFHGVPDDTWGSSDEENSLDESQISLELIEDLQQSVQSKLALEQPVTPAVPPPVLPLVPPITDDDEAVLKDIAELTGHGTEELKLDGVRITTHDLKTILPKLFNGHHSAWLNDNIVNDYLTLLVDKIKKDEGYVHKKDGSAPPVHNLSSQWFVSSERNMDNVVRWATKKQLGGIQLLDARLVLLPVCETGHWRLIVVNPKERSLEYLDSMGMSGGKCLEQALKLIAAILGPAFKSEEWTVIKGQRSRHQENTSDCGVFTILNALCLLRGDDPSTVDVVAGMGDARKRIALSLLENKISWGL